MVVAIGGGRAEIPFAGVAQDIKVMEYVPLRTGGVYYDEETERLAKQKEEEYNTKKAQDIIDFANGLGAIFEQGKAQDISGNLMTPEEAAKWDEEAKIRAANKNKTVTREISYWEVEDIFKTSIRDGDTYIVDGVVFSGSEMKEFQTLYESTCSAMPEPGDDLDYRDYAKMGIAVNSAKEYAQANMTEEQASIVEKVIKYRTSKIQYMEERMLKNYEVSVNPQKKYYNRVVEVGEDIGSEEPVYAQAVGSASDKGLAKQIMELFANVNILDADSVENVIKTYRNLMKPAYTELGGERTYAKEISTDEGNIRSWIANGKILAQNSKKGINVLA